MMKDEGLFICKKTEGLIYVKFITFNDMGNNFIIFGEYNKVK